VLKDEHGQKHNAFYRFSENSFNRIHAAYDQSLKWSLSHRRAVLGIFLFSIVASVGLFEFMPQDFLPSDDTGQLRGSIQTATGTSFDQTIKYVREVVQIIEKDPNVLYVQSDEGGDMTLALKPLNQRKLSADEIVTELRRKLRNIPGTSVTINNPPILRVGGRGARSTYQYTLQGLDFAQLQDTSTRLLKAMQEDPVFVGVNSDQDQAAPALQVDIDRDRAAALGITPDALEGVTGVAFGGQQVSQIYESVDQYQVVLELLPQYQQDPSALDRVYLTSKTGQMVPLSAVVKVSRSTMVQSIAHAGQVPAITVSFDLAPGYALSDAVSHVRTATEEIGMPATVSGAFAGTAAAFQSSTANMGVLMLIALIVVYIILGVLYESFIHPLTILSGLPSAAAGALLTLWIFGLPLTIYAYVGMMMLIGIVKKNAIMMIDFALQKKRGGANVRPEQAIYEAAMIRFRPIMMTTMAAMMGTLPIALGTGMGADSRRPLGLCVAGGLLLSQLLTLYITPVIYVYLDQIGDNFSFKKIWRYVTADASRTPAE
jgi:HAE1 family hydrophobic/amphiphilic exporter-1